jgi:hypothetical protein
VNERNASSPWKRLVLNSVKREENRVPSDSNGGIPGSRHLWVGDEHTSERSLSRTSERWSIGWVQKDQAWGWASPTVTQVHPHETRQSVWPYGCAKRRQGTKEPLAATRREQVPTA